jgi:tetratricopeptide (TPR) repeat protein
VSNDRGAILTNAEQLAFGTAEHQATAAAAGKDWKEAVGAWRGFLSTHPAHVPALRRLVGICVEGGLKAELNAAQLELVDAHILNGEAADARFVAEDLVAREPGVPAHFEALHRALVMAGEPDPDAIIAERRPKASVTDLESRAFELGPNAVDIERLLESDEPSPATADAIEVPAALDLTGPPQDLDEVFAGMRSDAARLEHDDGEERYREGLALFERGLVEEAIPPLTVAARAPKVRFVAADLLGRIYRDRRMPADAVDWFERAAEAPPPTRAEGHRLLYDLANLLESSGEIARALAIYMELRAEAGDFRDVAARVERLDEQARR